MFPKTNRPLKLTLMLTLAMLMVTVLAACGESEAPPPPPTRTPAPTFTPTVAAEAQPIDPAALATAQAAAQPPVVEVPPAGDTGTQPVEGATPSGEAQPPAAEATVAPTNTPEVKAQVSTTQQVNVRSGPSTNYAVIGLVDAGQTYDITGKNNAGDWWQITYNGQPGWVLGQLVTSANAGNVEVAQNIPVEPTPAPIVQAPPTNTPVPAPPAEQPTPAPAPSNYKFNVAVVGRCDPQQALNYMEGKTYINGVPQSGYKVVFSGTGPDAAWSSEPMVSGPHQGYEGWDQGFWSHIVHQPGTEAGPVWVWVVDDAGQRISEIAMWTRSGPVAEFTGCNQAVVDFDSR